MTKASAATIVMTLISSMWSLPLCIPAVVICAECGLAFCWWNKRCLAWKRWWHMFRQILSILFSVHRCAAFWAAFLLILYALMHPHTIIDVVFLTTCRWSLSLPDFRTMCLWVKNVVFKSDPFSNSSQLKWIKVQKRLIRF